MLSSHADNLSSLLTSRAVTHADKTLLICGDQRLTYREVDAAATRFAGSLHAIGVGKQDTVALMLPNGPEYIVAWMGIARLGAIQVGINTEYVGGGLAHLLTLSQARVLVIDQAFVPAVAAISDSLPHLETLVILGYDAHSAQNAAPAPWKVFAFDGAAMSAEKPPPVDIAGTDLLMLIFTSGTTGPAKAVSISHAYCLDLAGHLSAKLEYRQEDVIYTCYPLFHTDAAILTYVTALLLGATAAIGEKFSARGFWADVRRHEATVFDFMGAVLAILMKQPPSSDDRNHSVRLAMGGPKPENWRDFEQRFGVQIVEIYGATEMGHPVWDPLVGHRPDRAAGCVDTDRYELRIVDDADNEVPVGTSGEIVVRPRFASQHMSGYYRDPTETVRAWRNLWYHTRDRGHVDEAGWLYFEGRQSDSIRKRGNNMSATEIEGVLERHPQVLEVAAIGVPSELTEEEVKVIIVPRESDWRGVDDIVAWSRNRMPRYMQPRYIEFVADLPKSVTGKVQKALLRANWEGPAVHDVGDGSPTPRGR